MKYRPEIDGLRALAVLPVMIFHAGVSTLSGGFVGVDIFFVISGFLITSIIFREIESDKFSFINFYERRARRILPALYFVLIACMPLAWLFLIPKDLVDFSNSLMGVVTFISNIVFWLQTDYFSASSEYTPLLHTWSLAIEEQYYFFFPVLLIILYRFSTKAIFWSLSLILIASLLLAHFGSTMKPSATYYLLPTRLWELLVGSLIALCMHHNAFSVNKLHHNTQNNLSGLGFGLILLSFFIIDKNTPFPSLWALLPTVGTGLIILFANQGTWINRLLSKPFFVGIGLISYSAYLWHQPLYAFLRHQYIVPHNDWTMTAAFLSSLLLAFISWKYVEAPFRNKNITSRKFVFSTCFVLSLLILLAGWLGVHNKGFKNRFSMPPALSERTFALPKTDNGWCFYSVDTNDSLTIGESGQHCKLGSKLPKYNAILFGDSFAGMYEPFWQHVGVKNDISINSVTTNWCYPSFTDSFYWLNETPAKEQCLSNRAYVKKNIQDIDFIILSSVWSDLPDSSFKEVIALIDTLKKNKSLKVVVMPEPLQSTRASVMRSIYLNGHLERSNSEQRALKANAILENITLNSDRLLFLHRDELFKLSPQDNQGYDSIGIPYSLDGGHISIYGSTQAANNYLTNGGAKRLLHFLNQKKK